MASCQIRITKESYRGVCSTVVLAFPDWRHLHDAGYRTIERAVSILSTTVATGSYTNLSDSNVSLWNEIVGREERGCVAQVLR
jgi:hypothetical protein